MSRFALPLLLLLTFGGFAAEAEPPYLDQTHPVGNFLIGPQFAPDDVADLSEAGVALVISSRRPDEMDGLSFDQQTELEQVGIRYLTAPLGGAEYPSSPAALDRFSAAVAAAGPDQKILLHCRSGRRSSLLLAAYLVKHRGYSSKEAAAAVGRPDLDPSAIGKLLD